MYRSVRVWRNYGRRNGLLVKKYVFMLDSFNAFSVGGENASTLRLTSAYLRPRRFIAVTLSVSPNRTRKRSAGFMQVALEERRAIRRRSVSFAR